MRRLTPAEMRNSPIEFVGALDFDMREHGISPRRLPAWTRPQVPPMMDVMVRMPAGVRLAFVTDASRIELHVLTTTMVTPPRPPRAVAFDLDVDGEIHSAAGTGGNLIIINPDKPGDFELQRGEAYTVSFDLESGLKSCQLWLPHNAFVELRGLSLDDGARLEAPPPASRWVHYGSSISHCMEAETPTGTWPAIAASHAGLSLSGLGFGGQCHLDQFVARTIGDLDADVISIKTGINVVNMDSMRERTFVPALHGFLDTIRERRPQTPIIVASPIYCPSAEQCPGPTIADAQGKFRTLQGHEEIQQGCLTLTRIREIIQGVVEVRRQLGDPHLGYVDGLALFGEADADDLPDDLHPNPAGYRRLGERFARLVFTDGGVLETLR